MMRYAKLLRLVACALAVASVINSDGTQDRTYEGAEDTTQQGALNFFYEMLPQEEKDKFNQPAQAS